ncbi:hypothetical protein EDD27_5227 [Nonomuraea polychroma]|uniref:Uncharacterized protein n=1 Tax=Nonomuraea polychroma TaxID=46176 RepID=A0A438MA48_9ACTN|nr:hypothetical protein [Nonomuraea polychroma]RVX42591.1 hypothetical protein EDD27_5227 [Nonomuraea polychroma]
MTTRRWGGVLAALPLTGAANSRPGVMHLHEELTGSGAGEQARTS